jgi:uncharacterized heparinase superfamily protein
MELHVASPLDQIGRQTRTLLHLHPAQVWHRLRLQAQRKAVARNPDKAAHRWRVTPSRSVGLPESFRAIDADHLASNWTLGDLAQGRFDLLNEPCDLGNPINWTPPDTTQLWSFHLHYWEWAWALAADTDRDGARSVFAHHLKSWTTATTFGTWDGWAPYPASLRAWVLVNVHQRLAAGTDIEPMLCDSIELHAGFLEHNMELDVGGNHMIKNIKGLLGCAVFLGDDRLMATALGHLDREMKVQILPDGGHYELSPSYHCQVLADLADMAGLLAAIDHPPVIDLKEALTRMRRWLGEMLLPDGTLPLFNDSEPVAPGLIAALDPDAVEPRPLVVLPDSGYAVMRSDRMHLIADVGQPGPASPPGHIHADCLSFVLHVDGQPAIVDTGTSEYGSGPRRAHERSTAAHNTIVVDRTDQTEVFGAFRAGRRARATLERAEAAPDGSVEVAASHDGYRHLPGKPIHRRRWSVHQNTLTITDEVTGTGSHHLESHIHRPTIGGNTSEGTTQMAMDALEIEADPATEHTTNRCDLAAGFGNLVPGMSDTFSTTAHLPVVITTTITVRNA